MTRWFGLRVLAIGLPVAEIVLLIWVAATIGWGWTLLILLAGFVAGLALMRVAGANAFRAMAAPWRRSQPYVEIDETTGTAQTVHPSATAPTAEEVAEAGTNLRESGLLFLAGLLLALPGLLTDVVGLLLTLPFVRRRLASRMPAPTARDRVVVQGETVVVDTEGGVHVQEWSTADPAPSGRTVLRGEILPPQGGR